MSYRKIYEALKAYTPKRLIAEDYQTDEGRCAIGVLVSEPEKLPAYDVGSLYRTGLPAILRLVKDYECTWEELEDLQQYNDDGGHGTPEERYFNVLVYLQERVNEEAP